MGKNYNPADAFRKQQKAKQIKKNAVERKKKRDDKAVFQDTKGIEAELAYLKNTADLDDDGKGRLAKLEGELKYVGKLKSKYVTAHPEARDRVFRTDDGERRHDGHGGHGGPGPRREREDQSDSSRNAHLYNPDGTLRDPKRSAYYHPEYNPFGVPPPGMPYRERSRGPDDSDSDSDDSDDDSDDDDSDDSDDIAFPEGPRPDSDSESDSGESLDIPLPEGPRPPPALPAFPAGPPRGGFRGGARGRGGRGGQGGPGPHRGARGGARQTPYERPDPANPGGWGHLMEPASTSTGAGAGLPAKPSTSSLPPPPPSLPSKPGTAPITAQPVVAAPTAIATAVPTVAAAAPTSATISAAPQLRDLRKETTVFVPRAAQRKKAAAGPAVNAAPGRNANEDEEGDVRVVPRPAPASGLMGKLSSMLGPTRPDTDEGEDEYEAFLEGVE